MGLYETQNRLGQSETLVFFSAKTSLKLVSTKNKLRVSFCPVFHTALFSPTLKNKNFLINHELLHDIQLNYTFKILQHSFSHSDF
jgi:hypothetical protein